MRTRHLFLSVCLTSIFSPAYAQQEAALSVTATPTNELVIAIQHYFHERYGCSYPMTYEIDFPSGSSGLKVVKKNQTAGSWVQITEKTSADLFNAIEAVRFDYRNNRAYVSAAFSGMSDSLFLKIIDGRGNTVLPVYRGVSKYYDNRRGVVTVSFDDWANWNASSISTLLYMFRSHGLYTTGGIITKRCSSSTWSQIQKELDSGYVEAASHSRTHPKIPYSDPVGEIEGSSQDILDSLKLPPLFSLNGRGYVYTWISPYGGYDSITDSLVGVSGYLIPRIYVYGDSTLSAWDAPRKHFKRCYPTVELGAPSWGGGDTVLTSLNELFNTVVAKRGVYHLMWHPRTAASDIRRTYLISHLDYISGHNDIWYVNLGHLYLYHLLQMTSSSKATSATAAGGVPNNFELLQNYPNPFNPSTKIGYALKATGKVSVRVYDVLGREVARLVDGVQSAGQHSVTFDANNLPSGAYIYSLTTSDGVKITKKMLMIK